MSKSKVTRCEYFRTSGGVNRGRIGDVIGPINVKRLEHINNPNAKNEFGRGQAENRITEL